jgi:hypothetical protein
MRINGSSRAGGLLGESHDYNQELLAWEVLYGLGYFMLHFHLCSGCRLKERLLEMGAKVIKHE